MATSKATTVGAYLAQQPADRRATLSAVRDTVNAKLPAGYVEGIQYGMISWYVPLARYPDTYNGQPIMIASLAAQKNYYALYLLGVYGSAALAKWFAAAFAKAGKKLDMGKSCVRFKTLDALPLDVIGETIAKVSVDQLIAQHEAVHGAKKNAKPAAKAKAKATTTSARGARRSRR